jgi:hypothetical protein
VSAYHRLTLSVCALNVILVVALVVIAVRREDALVAAIFGTTLGLAIARMLLAFKAAGIRPLSDPLVWLGDQPWTGRLGDWLLRRYSLVEPEPHDPRHGE